MIILISAAYLLSTIADAASEQDHRRVKRLVKPGLGFGSFNSARWTLKGYEAMAMIHKIQGVHKDDVTEQISFIHTLFGIAA